MTTSGRRLCRTLTPALVALALASPASAEEAEPRPPMDYRTQAGKLSQPVYPATITEVLDLPMADGEKIYLEITRPSPAQYPDAGRLPVILEASPYHGASGDRLGTRIFPDPKQGATQIGLRGYFATRGYAVVMMDLRGTGRSTGCLDHLGPKDASDMKSVIEWAAAQPWSNGRVGMTGHSYVGSTPSIAAAQRPSGLVTIAPSAGLVSMYDHQFNRGVPWLLQWIGPMVGYEWLALLRDLPPGITPNTTGNVLGGSSGDNWMRGGPSAQTGCGMLSSSAISGTGQVTGQYELWHAKRDWREAASDLDIPVFIIHGVNDNAARVTAAEWFFAHRYRREGDKVWLGQWNHGSPTGTSSSCANGAQQVPHPNCRFLQWQYALHAWFDHHLMQRTWTDAEGIVHEIDTGPPVEVFLNGTTPRTEPNEPRDPSTLGTRVFTAGEWRKYPRLDLYQDASDMSLRLAAPSGAASATYSGTDVVSPFVSPSSLHVGANLAFISAPFEEGVLFVGLPKLSLRASLANSQIAHLTATLYRQDSGGDREPMSFCAIQPMLRYGIATPEPIVPGQRMTLPMQCFTMAHKVEAGDRLVLELSTATRHHATFGSEAQITVFTGPSETVYSLPEVEGFTLFDDVPAK